MVRLVTGDSSIPVSHSSIVQSLCGNCAALSKNFPFLLSADEAERDESIRDHEHNQQEAIYILTYYSQSALHISCDVFAHHQENLTIFTVSGGIHPSCCRLDYNPVSTHSRFQPAATWVNTNRYCKFSQVLLMIGENIRNM